MNKEKFLSHLTAAKQDSPAKKISTNPQLGLATRLCESYLRKANINLEKRWSEISNNRPFSIYIRKANNDEVPLAAHLESAPTILAPCMAYINRQAKLPPDLTNLASIESNTSGPSKILP